MMAKEKRTILNIKRENAILNQRIRFLENELDNRRGLLSSLTEKLNKKLKGK